MARALGRRLIVLHGGTQATNRPAIAFYRKFGFRAVGHFLTGEGRLDNLDMILDL